MKNFRIINKNVLLDNGSTYKIVYSTSLSEQTIFYMINVNDFSDLKFCYGIGDNEFEEVRDVNKIKIIVKELNKYVNIFLR